LGRCRWKEGQLRGTTLATQGEEIHLNADILSPTFFHFLCIPFNRLIFWRLTLLHMSLKKRVHESLLLSFFEHAFFYTLFKHPPCCTRSITRIGENGVYYLRRVKAKSAESA
jgi:hypothetical protein